ncbi:MAG TPA: hypothetical protein PKD99_09690 [Sphingopyxis sp.]|nr:hypothetical protein [Sphingopyxis sp.]HMP45365.1 hypothetical protein [Sphingopyxis sp.]HMQ18400.1 hypothetical protein [Sphingopyxis sp.]
MPQKFLWSLGGNVPGGAGVNAGGTEEVDAITSAEVQLAEGVSTDRELALQIDDVDKLAFFILTSSLNDGSVEVETDTATRTKLTGPVILFGEAIKLFAGDLDKIKLKNASATTAADIRILMGSKLG